MAGLLGVDADLTVSIDADLQDDVEAYPQNGRGGEGRGGHRLPGPAAAGLQRPIKRVTARGYYKLLSVLGAEVVFDHADFRLMSRRAVDALKLYGERNFFLRALVPQLGFPTSIVYYDRAPRAAGVSKYPLRKMLALALEGITSFSTKPLRMVTWLGILLSLISATLAVWAIGAALLGATVPGWASTVVPIYVVCGVQLFSLGVIGEYIGKIYLETKARPRFVVADVIEAGRSAGASAATQNDETRENLAGIEELHRDHRNLGHVR